MIKQPIDNNKRANEIGKITFQLESSIDRIDI
jgi:hypothetical protein